VCEKSIHAQELVFHEEFIETLLYYEVYMMRDSQKNLDYIV